MQNLSLFSMQCLQKFSLQHGLMYGLTRSLWQIKHCSSFITCFDSSMAVPWVFCLFDLNRCLNERVCARSRSWGPRL